MGEALETDMTDKELCIDLAKGLMGWDFWDCMEPAPGFPMFADWNEGRLAVYEDEISGDVTRYWAPLEKIEDAWEVLEKVSTLSFPLQCRFVRALGKEKSLSAKQDLALMGERELSLSWHRGLFLFLFCMDACAVICRAAWTAIQVDEFYERNAR